MQFLDEREALKAVRDVLEETETATIAVAFWGAGAIDSLGLRKQWRSLRIVCNLESGACNPSEIEDLINLGAGVEVRSDPRLHGKVYLTGTQLLLGSSNASSNGLVVEGPTLSGWAEANILTTDDALISRVAKWCEERFQVAGPITSEKLELARAAWRARRAASPVAGGLSKDLLASVRSQPDHCAFRTIKLVQWARAATTHATQVHEKAIEGDQSLVGTDFYEGWGADMSVGDWLIDFDATTNPASFTGYWQVVHIDKTNDLAFVRKKSSIEIPTIGNLKVSKKDLSRLATIISTLPGKAIGAQEKVTPVALVVSSLDNSTKIPDSKAFDKAMLAIYDQAAAFGYFPNEFRFMVETLGGVGAARQLINKVRVSQGFTRLWEESRLDLSVEALAVSPKWRALFTSDEIKRCKQRLSEVGYATDL